MSFTTNEFAMTWPFLYHLTDAGNVANIKATGHLKCALHFLPASEYRSKRCVSFTSASSGVMVRDQKPLYAGNIAYDSGWTFGDVIYMLNERVFFWPGTIHGPNEYGKRHFSRYSSEDPAVLRVSSADAFAINGAVPEFCKYNSGAPRCNRGNKSPRGVSTFLCGQQFAFASRDVKEVTFKNEVVLPTTTELGDTALKIWSKL